MIIQLINLIAGAVAVPGGAEESFFALYKILFTLSLGLILVISGLVVMAMKKARENNDKQLSHMEKQTELLEKCLAALNEIKGSKMAEKQDEE